MNEFKRKNKHSFWQSPLVVVLLFMLLIFSAYKVIGLIQKEKETSKKKELVLEKIEFLRKREESLNTEIARFETEDGIEDAIREKYQVVKEGEKMVIIVDEEENYPPVEEKSDHGFLGWLKNIFSNK